MGHLRSTGGVVSRMDDLKALARFECATQKATEHALVIIAERDRLRDLLSQVAGSSYMVTSLPGHGPTIELHIDAALWAEIREAVAS